MPKHSFGLLGVNVKKMNARKNPKRLLHDFTGNGDDLLSMAMLRSPLVAN